MWWPFKRNKFKNIVREDLVNSICELERQERTAEAEITQKQKEIDALLEKGKKEKTDDLKLLYAKKINHLKEEKASIIERGMYLLYNIRLMNKLKDAYDSNAFFKTKTKVPLSELLADQKGLARFLNKALETRISAEDVLTSADDLFTEIQGAYDKNESIYGLKREDEELLSSFEKAGALEDEEIIGAEKENPKKKKIEEEE